MSHRRSRQAVAGDEVSWLREQFTTSFGAAALARADETFGSTVVDDCLVRIFKARLKTVVEGVLENGIDVRPLSEPAIADLEDAVVNGVGKLTRLPELQGVPVAELLLRLHAALLRAMRRQQRRGGGQRRTKEVDDLVREFETLRQPKQDKPIARRILAKHDPNWLTYTDEARRMKINALLRRARRHRQKRGHN